MFFNTTVHAGNFADVPMLTAFFTAHAEVVRFGSFQLQADTGRGAGGQKRSSALPSLSDCFRPSSDYRQAVVKPWLEVVRPS